jgi:hypothetical protein
MQLCFHRINGFTHCSRHVTTIIKSDPNYFRSRDGKRFSKEPLKIDADADDNADDHWGTSSDSKSGEVRQNFEKDIEASLDSPKEDRDLFIPIFSLVALTGLIGVYGFEMIRLFLRGELYLPFIH